MLPRTFREKAAPLRTHCSLCILNLMRLLALTALLAFSACDSALRQPSLDWKESYTAAECKALVSVQAIEARCGDRQWQDSAECLPFSSPRRMSGVWVEGFEYSAFFEGARSWNDVSEHAFDFDQGLTWLSAKGGVNLPGGRTDSFGDYEVFHIEFTGRRSLCAFGYGHLGGSKHEVIAERIIATKPLAIVEEPTTSAIR